VRGVHFQHRDRGIRQAAEEAGEQSGGHQASTGRAARFAPVGRVDGHHRLTLVAEIGGTMAGVASYERDGDTDTAEAAFVVADGHQGRGVGTVLLEHLAADARERGITRFTAMAQAGNRPVHALIKAVGLRYESHIDRAEDYLVIHLE
jgi:GNAT superfamily N-acetyltransferase